MCFQKIKKENIFVKGTLTGDRWESNVFLFHGWIGVGPLIKGPKPFCYVKRLHFSVVVCYNSSDNFFLNISMLLFEFLVLNNIRDISHLNSEFIVKKLFFCLL